MTLTRLAACTDKQSATELVQIEQTLTIKQALAHSPVLVDVRCGSKLENIRQIIRVVEFFLSVTGHKMEPLQIQVLAGDLYERFRTDTLDDIILMLKMARQGEFGKVYRVDSFTIMEWVPLYMERKSAEREKMVAQQKRALRERELQARPTPQASQKLQELQDRLRHAAEKQRQAYTVKGALNSLERYLADLPETSMALSDKELKLEIERTAHCIPQAYEILALEQERRRTEKRNNTITKKQYRQ